MKRMLHFMRNPKLAHILFRLSFLVSGVNLKCPVVRFWDISRMGSFGGLGAEPPTAGGLAGAAGSGGGQGGGTPLLRYRR